MARRRQFSDADFGDFGIGLGGPSVAGPLIGGGVARVGELAAKLLFKTKPGVVKWSPSIGFGLGAAVSLLLAMRPGTRSTGISGLITAALVGLPPQIESLVGGGTMKGGYLGVVTAEEQLQGYDGMGAEGVTLISGSGGTGNGLGVVTAEEQMNGAEGDITLLGQSGDFGANFGI